ncbi:MAG: hypothetical protein AAGJ40_09725 [Planctomycetota bacterium]
MKRSRGDALKRTRIKPQSERTRDREAEARPWRQQRVKDYGKCWICGTCPEKPIHPIADHNRICVHEIANVGGMRQRAMDKPFATLVLCWKCNLDVEGPEWPEVRQLALLQSKVPEDYDLVAYNELVGFGPNRIEQWEVDEWRF